jgi:hypothetical protein
MDGADEELIELFARDSHHLSKAIWRYVTHALFHDRIAAGTFDFYRSYYGELDRIRHTAPPRSISKRVDRFFEETLRGVRLERWREM